jgi:hypothetical protein
MIWENLFKQTLQFPQKKGSPAPMFFSAYLAFSNVTTNTFRSFSYSLTYYSCLLYFFLAKNAYGDALFIKVYIIRI